MSIEERRHDHDAERELLEHGGYHLIEYRVCRECGCSDEPGGGTIWWVEDDLCSECAAELEEELRGLGERCASCLSPILWALTESGRRTPLDPEPVSEGNILLSHRRVGEPPVALVQNREAIAKLAAEHERSPQEGPLRLYRSHFATCPNAGAHRRAKRQTAATGGGE